MREFLFLYPIEPYVDGAFSGQSSAEDYSARVQRLNDTIQARYRQGGFNINWLMFTDGLEQLASGVDVQESDRILTCGVSFKTHCAEKIYPDEESIINQLPKRINQLIIAGFHLWDCVDKIAEAGHNSGIPTFVDEDLTELFFMATKGRIPLVRDIRKVDIQPDWRELWVEYMRGRRESKPWLARV